MKNIYFTPGPSQLYPTFLKHLKNALDTDLGSISHRGEKFQEIFFLAQKNLRQLMNIPKDVHIFFLSSSLESMERIIENCVGRYSFHLVNGAFSKKFYDIAYELGKYTERIISKDGHGFDADHLSVPVKSEIICVTQNETSTGVQIPESYIHKLHQRFPKKLIAVDIVSSAPYPQIDYSKVDISFFSVQKGFGMPAGLGVLTVNERALEKAKYLTKKGINIGSFHSFPALLEKEIKGQTPETPNTIFIYLLGKICEDMLKKGIDKIRNETEQKAKMVYDFFDRHEVFHPFVKDKEFRSKTSIVIDTGVKTDVLHKELVKQGLILGRGYGDYKMSQIRIANFPVHSIGDFKTMLKAFDKLARS